MASAWGISRTMAEVHALLYVTGEPMCADDVMDRLAISRGNASMSIRALLEWGVLSRTHKRGDRKEYFQAEQDVWAMFRAIARERIKREVDPLVASLDEIRALTPRADAKANESLRELNKRLDAMHEFFELVSTLSQRFAGPTGAGLKIAAKILSKAPVPGGRDARHSPDHPIDTPSNEIPPNEEAQP